MDNESFEKGRESLRAGDYKAAECKFRQAFNSVDEAHALYNRAASYLGLSQVLISDLNGLLLCRDAASSETRDGDVFLNLACAEWHTGSRGRAIDAVAWGRKVDRKHEQLIQASLLLDTRRRSAIPLLPREHLLNRLFGRMMRRSRTQVSVHDLLY